MKKQNKSLLIHNDIRNNQTTAIVVEEKDILQKTKEFLKKLSKDYSPPGIVLSAEGKTKSYAVAYEKDNFIIVERNGSGKSARLYGNWDEALICAKKILTQKGDLQGKTRVTLAQYTK